MYHDVMNPKPSMGYHPKCKKPINHEIQLLFKYENLYCVGCVCVGGGVCVCVCVCVCTYEIFPWPRTVIYLFIYLCFLYSG